MASDEISINNVKEAHIKARNVMKKINPNVKIGLSLALPDVQSIEGGEQKAEEAWDKYFKQFVDTVKDDDFFGIQNYTREVYNSEGQVQMAETAEKTECGYEYYPEGLAGAIRKVAIDLKMPILVTENGLATKDDSRRVEFVKSALKGVYDCISDDIEILGYIYWSAFDNFEWTFGYNMHFGVIEVNRELKKEQ